MKLRTRLLAGLVALALTGGATAQLIYGNTFPFWNVNGPLIVTGDTTLTGGTNAITGTTTIGAGATLTSPTITGATLTTAALTSPAITTSITTASTSFTALAGATTLLTLGGTGASASTLFPSTLDTSSSITGAIRTSGGISAAKAANIGTTLTVGTTSTLTGIATASTQLTTPVLTTTGAMQFPAPRTVTSDGAVGVADTWLIANKAGTLTLTLPDPTTAGNTGRMLCVKTSQAQTVVSASSNVVPLITGSAATAILAATAGKWACMLSDATNWVIMSAN